MQIFKDEARQHREIRFGRDHFATRLQLGGSSVQKIDRVLEMMQHVRKRNHIQAGVFDAHQLVDLVAIKNQIEIIKFEDITGYYVRMKSLERRGAASDLENR